MTNILVVDDDLIMCGLLCQITKNMGHDSLEAHTLTEARGLADRNIFDIVLLDVNLPDGSGLVFLKELRRKPDPPEVIIITSEGDANGAELAIKSGAWDYVTKPFSRENIQLQITRAVDYRNAKSKHEKTIALKRDAIIGSSPQMQECLDLLADAASTNASVLITGETGTGKELFAQAIHENSSRKAGSFVVLDCAALPESLVESILFGYQKGAFTGAEKDKQGLIQQADGGTLFLDEIGDLSPAFQKIFLRVLQERNFRPLGAKTEEKSDFRLVAATNRDLRQMAETGAFRSDLLFRLQTITIKTRPLRERPQDIKELAQHFIIKYCERNAMGSKGFVPEFMDGLTAYPWPGNVRELINALEHAVTMARDDEILIPRHLPEHIRVHIALSALSETTETGPSAVRVGQPLPTLQQMRETVLADAEHIYLNNLIKNSTGDIKEACRISGLGRAHLYALLKKHGLSLRAQ